jgi:hypothetical protein
MLKRDTDECHNAFTFSWTEMLMTTTTIMGKRQKPATESKPQRVSKKSDSKLFVEDCLAAGRVINVVA